tara:strand:- start:583 stop:1272 length:690 start_codon:yes stop_codon:yes gene_type:complete
MSTATFNDLSYNTAEGFYMARPNRIVNGVWNERVAPGDCGESCALNVQDLVNKFGYERYKIMWVIADSENMVVDEDEGMEGGLLSSDAIIEMRGQGKFIHIFVYDMNTNHIIDKSQGKVLFESLEVCRARYIHRYAGQFSLTGIKLSDLKDCSEANGIPTKYIFKYSFLFWFCMNIISTGRMLKEYEVKNIRCMYQISNALDRGIKTCHNVNSGLIKEHRDNMKLDVFK